MHPEILRTCLPLSAACALLSSSAFAQVTNIAPAGVASQVSNWNTSTPAEDAIDGNANPFFSGGSMQHTANTMNAWWRVDFHADYEMFEARLFNRADCSSCPGRLSNFRVSVYDDGVEVYGLDLYVGAGAVPEGGIETIPLPPGTYGDAFQVQLLGWNNVGNGYLHMSEVEIDGHLLGDVFCASNPNSSGVASEALAVGSPSVADNAFGLIANGMPDDQFGYFLCSLTPGNTPAPGSQGILCLGGQIARFNQTVLQNTDNGEAFGTGIDLASIPLPGGVAVQPGQTWYFQAWFRDGSTSNFSSGRTVAFF